MDGENSDIIDDLISHSLDENDETPVDTSQSQGSSNESSSRKYFESDGEIGYRKGQSFSPVTNFSVKCTGYVTNSSTSTSVDGFLLDVIPKESVRSLEDVENHEKEIKR